MIYTLNKNFKLLNKLRIKNQLKHMKQTFFFNCYTFSVFIYLLLCKLSRAYNFLRSVTLELFELIAVSEKKLKSK